MIEVVRWIYRMDKFRRSYTLFIFDTFHQNWSFGKGSKIYVRVFAILIDGIVKKFMNEKL